MRARTAVALLLSVAIMYAIPQTIQYQGKLTDMTGIGENDTLDMTFKIYDSETEGTELWAETHAGANRVPVIHGLFDVTLGEMVIIDLPFDVQYWLEMDISGVILVPRMPLTASPYAFHAAVADSFTGGGGQVDAVVGGAGIIVDSTDTSRPIVSTKLRTGGGLNNTLGTGSDELSLVDGTTDGQVLKWNGTSGEWELRPDDVGSGSVPDGFVENDMLTWDEMSTAWIAEPLSDALIPDEISIDNAAITALDGGADATVHGVLIADTLASPLDTLYLPEIVWMDELVTDSIEARNDVVKIRDALWIQDSLYFDGGWRNDWPSGSSDADWTLSGLNMYSTVAGNVGIGTETMEGRLHVLNEIDSIVYESFLYDFEGVTIEPCTTYGDADWSITDEDAFSGTHCARSGVGVGLGVQSFLELEVSFASDSVVNFAKKTSVSTGTPLFQFFIDGELVDSWFSSTAWEVVSYPVSAGAHTFIWSTFTSFTSQGVFYVDSINYGYGISVPLSSRAFYSDGIGISDAAVFMRGNVGIGTESPTKLLDVNGDAHFSGDLEAETARIGNPGSNGQSNAQEASDWADAGYIETPWVYANNIQASDERGAQGTGIAIGNSHTNFDSTENDEIALYTSGRSRLLVASDGDIGIGVTDPLAKLHINGSGVIGALLDNAASWTGSHEIPDNGCLYGGCGDDGYTEVTAEVTGYPSIVDIQIEISITHPRVGELCIWLVSPEGTEVCLSEYNGGTGDNYTNTIFNEYASTSIDDGTAPFTGFYQSTYSRLFDLVGEDPNGTWSLRVCDDGLTDIGSITEFRVYLTGLNELDFGNLIVSGNVGIRTSSPSAELDVNGLIQTSEFKMTSGASAGYILKSNASGKASWVNPASLSDGDWTINGSDLYSAVSGNVGIGTSTPYDPLHIQAYDTTDGIDDGVFMSIRNTCNAESSYCGIRFKNHSNDDDQLYKAGILWQRTASYGRGDLIFAIQNGGNNVNVDPSYDRMVITGNGNVGIDVREPEHRLEVVGTTELNGDTDINGNTDIDGNMVLNGSFNYGSASSGSGDPYEVTIDGIDSYTGGMVVVFQSHISCPATPTISINGMAAKEIRHANNNNVTAGQIGNDDMIVLIYNGSNFRWISD